MDNLNRQGIKLIQEAFRDHDDKYGSGSMSCAIYDTAWVSLVKKNVEGKGQWLFPECFHHILLAQSDEGDWSTNTASEIDNILNTAASLLTLKRHQKEPLNCDMSMLGGRSINERIASATAALQTQLAAWDVASTAHVGFEIIVPAMLRYLQDQDEELVFEFAQRSVLDEVHGEKMARFTPKILYGKKPVTLLHSLEVLIGVIDFDKVAHHKVNGSMMASPSSTAAYLMNRSVWDAEAEDYLRHVMLHGAGKGSGGMPSAYPSTYFEYTWILSTLFGAGFDRSDLQCLELDQIEAILRDAFQKGNGTIGFAPHLGADVDDTAKGIISLTHMGGQLIDPKCMLRQFERDTHFQTYAQERDPSLSANCNALLALMSTPEPRLYSIQICKTVAFITEHWWKSDNHIRDKWNISNLYSCLLLVESIATFLSLVETDKLKLAPDGNDNILSRAAISAYQACLHTVHQVQSNGSWNDSIEETSYAVLALCEGLRLDFCVRGIGDRMRPLIQGGIDYIRSRFGDDKPITSPIWIEKVTYSSPLLAGAYVLAAFKAAQVRSSFLDEDTIGKEFTSTQELLQGQKLVKLLSQTPLFSSSPPWCLKASMVESMLFRPLLRQRRLDVFPRKDMEKDKYFDIIPFTWTSCNNRQQTFASTNFLFEMMVISFLNYQADEFMEAVAGPAFQGRPSELRTLIRALFKADNSTITLPPSSDEVHDSLQKFVKHVLRHPSVAAASTWDQACLTKELLSFLLAHVDQNEANAEFQTRANSSSSDSDSEEEPPEGMIFASAPVTFFNWVRTTSADHTSCPYSFYFVGCLLSSQLLSGQECFPTVQDKYLASATCRHLATMCRMYNDYGSVARDAAEKNLNSVNFPEYAALGEMGTKKLALFDLAQYERSCLDRAMLHWSKLAPQDDTSGCTRSKSTAARQMILWNMFHDVTDLYGQIYVVRDIASRMTHGAPNGNGHGNGNGNLLKRKASSQAVASS